MRKLIIALAIGLLVLGTATAWAGNENEKKVAEIRQLAEQGDVEAQFVLGVMYENGKGVARNYAEALKWYRRAAEQGDAWAQGKMGLMYARGRGVPQNLVTAYMWSNLAAAQGIEIATKHRDLFAMRMTKAEIAEAKRLAAEWKPKRPSNNPTGQN